MFAPPRDLSSLPGYETKASTVPQRTAFLGRCSTKDNQDPRSSIMGQADEARALLDDGEDFVGYWWDVESGMLDLDNRGQVTDAEYAALGIPLPRDGGLKELLDTAERGGITRVVCERISRVARDTLVSLTVEAHLKKLGVPVECANEPQGGTETGRLRVRRGGQMEAEIFRAELMEMSMRGQRRHAADGYQHGPPCYGYVALVDPDATVTPNRFGVARPKKRLALHPDRRKQDTIREVFRLRVEERWKNSDIRRLLESAPSRHPVEVVWTDARVKAMLRQPKYTGFQVYNKRSKTSQFNPISEWVWSSEKAHPEIVPFDTWYEAQAVTAQMRTREKTGLDRVREAAHGAGLSMTVARSNTSHVVYRIGRQEYVVPRGELADTVADAIIDSLGGAV
ncbi:recombinase family protein [Nocardiopsis sp. CT-R113]|uniref:Recombinase family protein n=1 Tax=Nocardiopsis codii TaxID=3065942 RepID=A0ABU7KD52_9ACTN|nr:recombinase family protein [Nocardiopsis sp. CT-R113]MEE2040160.1 recombinase family protein [Nocardiopsis sp. CT-R113]